MPSGEKRGKSCPVDRLMPTAPDDVWNEASDQFRLDVEVLLGSEMPTISRHLSQLRNAGIVEDEKRGAQVFYRLVTPCVMNFFQCVASVREKAPK